jgi:RNA polymerase sigma-70 factor (ECF subfamily)
MEDVVQETLVRAFRSYESFRGDCSFFTWAYSILARVASETNRRSARGIPDEVAFSWVQQPGIVEDTVALEEDARRVVDAIRVLPERQRQMVTLHFLEDLSYKEIARALDVSVGTVKATLFAARSALRPILERDKTLER